MSTTKDRLKHRQVKCDPRVALTVVDPAKPLRYIEIRGTVTLTDDPNGMMRDQIAAKHGFSDGGAFDQPGTSRVTMAITPHASSNTEPDAAARDLFTHTGWWHQQVAPNVRVSAIEFRGRMVR